MKTEHFLSVESTFTTNERGWQSGEHQLVENKIPPVDAEWVIQSFNNSVRLNSDGGIARDNLPELRELPQSVDSYFSPFILNTKITDYEFSHDPPDEIMSVLLNNEIRRGSVDQINSHIDTLKYQIGNRTLKGRPLSMVLPTLPFKDQNPLTTRHKPSFVDLGEYLMFAQMRNIQSSIREVYRPGMHMTILTDGLVYSDIFGDKQIEEINAYRENCTKIRDQLGMRHNTDIVDMAWVVEQESRFNSVRETIRNILEENSDNPVLQHSLPALQRGMIWNIPLSGYSYQEVVQLIKDDQLSSELEEITREAALSYSSFLLTMQNTRVISRAFPGSVRATVHPKKAAQIPLHLVNKKSHIFPYNGVPVVSASKFEKTHDYQDSTRIMRFCDVLRYSEAKEVYLPGGTEPFYYQIN